MESVPHLIKVLNGPHAGAQSGFAEGEELVIGSSPDADIHLSDPHIAPLHFKIKASGEEYLVTPVEGVVMVDDQRIPEPTAIRMGQVVTAGSTSLGFGPSGCVWPDLRIPSPSVISGAMTPAPEEATPTPEPPQKPDRSNRGILHYALIGALVSVVLIAGWLLFSNDKAPRKPPAYPGDVEKMRSDNVDVMSVSVMEPLSKLLKKEIPGVNTTIDRTRNNYQLRIFVRTEDEAKKARRIVGENGSGVFAEVIDLDDLENTLSLICNPKKLRVKITAQSDGTLQFNGYVEKSADLEPVLAEISADLPFLNTSNREGLVFGDKASQEILSMLKNANHDQSLSVIPKADGIHITGPLEAMNKALSTGIIKKIKETYGTELIHIDGTSAASSPAPELQKILGAPVAGITYGNGAWIELANGSRLFPGSVLPNGKTLQSITPGEIVLSGKEGVVRITLPAGGGIPSSSPRN
jgi:type III secretion system YscD/HrpQ family protein